ncbi:MAG: hypothetical protein ACXABY_34515, partial [Candidatus Thorarchaeota archaeon]
HYVECYDLIFLRWKSGPGSNNPIPLGKLIGLKFRANAHFVTHIRTRGFLSDYLATPWVYVYVIT